MRNFLSIESPFSLWLLAAVCSISHSHIKKGNLVALVAFFIYSFGVLEAFSAFAFAGAE